MLRARVTVVAIDTLRVAVHATSQWIASVGRAGLFVVAVERRGSSTFAVATVRDRVVRAYARRASVRAAVVGVRTAAARRAALTADAECGSKLASDAIPTALAAGAVLALARAVAARRPRYSSCRGACPVAAFANQALVPRVAIRTSPARFATRSAVGAHGAGRSVHTSGAAATAQTLATRARRVVGHFGRGALAGRTSIRLAFIGGIAHAAVVALAAGGSRGSSLASVVRAQATGTACSVAVAHTAVDARITWVRLTDAIDANLACGAAIGLA